ncbi:beta-ketoacyl-[acyl-carrier-protein] synthase family protein [Streptomyces acidiscabies]|uniref:beta-ketoacyl-[acyl-carrier-protein] synthase family protein n=1 Tax=Streptomyces acidiscabies TaxID=42234 RepID=UPI0009519F1B|nr:beta-ketoacyl-[acyl-carrier-protein] synthase family protein [Streptomyces acidiscabies]
MQATDIAVTGIGLVTPAGIGADTTWAGVCLGDSLAASDPLLSGLRTDFSCAVPALHADALLGVKLARRLDAFVRFALIAADQAVADAALDPDTWCAERVGVVLGVGSNSLESYEQPFRALDAGRAVAVSPFAVTRSVPSMAAGEVALRLGARGVTFTTSSACASGTTALGTAIDLLRAGRCDIVLAGGSESARSRMTAACFARMGALSTRCGDPAAASRPFDRDRDGFVLGEGAAVLVLERATDAVRRKNARVRGILAGYGAAADAYHPTAPDPDGHGAEIAVRAALADAGCTPSDIDHINAHGTSTPLNDAAESRLLHRLFPAAPPVTATKSVLGHALGAAGAIEAAITLLTLENGVIPPVANLSSWDAENELDLVTEAPRNQRMTTALSTSFGFGGQNAVLVVRGP